MEKVIITGLHGCSCHPFASWEEHDQYAKQTIVIGKKYKCRHSGRVGVAEGIDKEFVNMYMEPYDCERCREMMHKSNLILVESN